MNAPNKFFIFSSDIAEAIQFFFNLVLTVIVETFVAIQHFKADLFFLKYKFILQKERLFFLKIR